MRLQPLTYKSWFIVFVVSSETDWKKKFSNSLTPNAGQSSVQQTTSDHSILVSFCVILFWNFSFFSIIFTINLYIVLIFCFAFHFFLSVSFNPSSFLCSSLVSVSKIHLWLFISVCLYLYVNSISGSHPRVIFLSNTVYEWTALLGLSSSF